MFGFKHETRDNPLDISITFVINQKETLNRYARTGLHCRVLFLKILANYFAVNFAGFDILKFSFTLS